MTVKPPPPFWQPSLIDVLPDKPISRNGEARTRYGRVVEEIACELLGLSDIPNSGSHECVFDAFHHASGYYCEIKSLRRNNKIPVYEWRRAKDRECGVPLVYVICIHDCRDRKTLADVYRTMASTMEMILVLPAWAIDLKARRCPLRRILAETPRDARQGYSRAGYCEGYRNVPYDDLLDTFTHAPRHTTGELHGIPLATEVLFHRSLTPW